MKNTILNEELDKMKFMFGYQKGRVISEQSKSPEQEIYDLLYKGTLGPAGGVMGTSIEKLKQGFGKFTGPKQLLAVEKMMNDKPMGTYSNLSALLRGELELDNYKDFLEIQKMVEPKGIYLKSGPVDKRSGQWPYNTITISAPTTSTPAEKPRTTPSGYNLPQQPRTTPSGYNLPKQTNNTNQLSQDPLTPRVDNKPKVTFKPNDNFPIKFMDSGEKVKQLQTALGVVNKAGQPNITGKFYTSTEQKLVNKMKELGLTYDRNKGVDEETFNLVLSGPKPSRQIEKPIEMDRKDVNLNVPKNKITTKAPTIKTPQTDLSLEQQYQLADIEFEKANDALKAAQETGDRAQIGAARGIQQAARIKRRELERQLYPPQQ